MPPGGHLWTEIGGRKEKTSGGAHACLDAGFTHTRTLGGVDWTLRLGDREGFLKSKDGW